MSDYDTEEEQCVGEGACDDPSCDEREYFEVEFTYTVKGTVRAHSQEEADNLTGDMQMDITGPQLPEEYNELWEDLSDDESDSYVESSRARMQRQQEMHQEMERLMAEEEQAQQ